MSALSKIVEITTLNRKIEGLSDRSLVLLNAWTELLKKGDRAAIAEGRLHYEETIAMWMDAHERLAVLLNEILQRPR